MWIHISCRQMDDIGTFSSGIVTGWGGMSFGQRWRRLWSRLSAWVGSRCTYCFASTVCRRILCGAILARDASGRVVLMQHSRVSFYRSLHHVMPRQLDTLLLLFSDFCPRFLHEILHFLHCGPQKPFFGHFGHIQGQEHVGLFQLYPTSLLCHSSGHVENLQEISYCF